MNAPNSHRDRRNCERFPAHLAMTLLPIDADHQPVGDACDVISVDLSQSGVCCFCDRPFIADLAIVRLQAAASEEEVALLAKRVRCLRKGQFFEVALQFMGKLPATADPVAT